MTTVSSRLTLALLLCLSGGGAAANGQEASHTTIPHHRCVAADDRAEPAQGHHAVGVPAGFAVNIERYMELRRTVTIAADPLVPTSDAEEIYRRTAAIAAAIRDARLTARGGDIFTPAFGGYLRTHLATVIRDSHVDVTRAFADAGDEGTLGSAVQVNGEFPWSVGSGIWTSLLWQLPPLPEELQYRFVGADLLLVDVPASLVVDVLHDALPAGARDTTTGSHRDHASQNSTACCR
jgi:hypothetical protein